MNKLFSIDSQLYKVTGVEKVMLDIHKAVREDYEAKIVGNIPYNKIRSEHGIKEEEYIQFKNPFMFYNSIVVVHERRLLMLFWLLNHLLFQRIKIVYVHHNIFHDHKWTTFLPKTIVAIADRGIENLTDFFGAPRNNIHKIYNCVEDKGKTAHAHKNHSEIRLLLPGRINKQKQQLEIVRHLKGKLDSRIKILFAGDGPQYDQLKSECEGLKNFEVLGFRNDITDLISECDYVFLYSVHEGLPITLIEATMMGCPIVCSDVGGNPEICHNGENGWVLHSWDELIETLNNLPNVSDEIYASMCKRSHEIYEQNFTFDIFKNNYLKLFSSLS